LSSETIILILILLAGFYMAWSIGANDVANAMGTSVGSKALTLRQAVFIAAILEFSGAFFFGSHVSETVQNGIVDSTLFASHSIDFVYGMLASLLATGAWLQIASYKGWPVSTTHSIVGALVGFGAIIGGIEAIYWGNIAFIVSTWVISPLIGGIISYFIFTFLRNNIFFQPNPVEAAKRFSPFLIFLVFSILSLLIIYKGLHNIYLPFSLFSSIWISLTIGIIAAGIGYLFIQKLTFPKLQPTRSGYDVQVVRGLNKAIKHMNRAHAASSGKLQDELSSILAEIEGVASHMKAPDLEYIHGEFGGVEKIFSYLQIVTACLMAFAHGANDVANAIGPIAAAITVLKGGLVAESKETSSWILALGGGGIVIGLATWGWRVIETIGHKITELTPTRGFAAEFGAALTILLASRLGLPISTTHTLVGAVIGIGLARGIEAINLNTTRDIFVSWIVTIPTGACITVLFYYAIKTIFG
jgi:inorganic phosphate transporter, PiT family